MCVCACQLYANAVSSFVPIFCSPPGWSCVIIIGIILLCNWQTWRRQWHRGWWFCIVVMYICDWVKDQMRRAWWKTCLPEHEHHDLHNISQPRQPASPSCTAGMVHRANRLSADSLSIRLLAAMRSSYVIVWCAISVMFVFTAPATSNQPKLNQMNAMHRWAMLSHFLTQFFASSHHIIIS